MNYLGFLNESKYWNPIFNAELYLEGAIKSVIQQSLKDWELILVDDGSTDNSLDIARSFAQKDTRIRVISDGLNKNYLIV